MGVVKKKSYSFVIRCIFGPLTTYGVIAALIGSIFTNIGSLSAKYPPFVANNLAIVNSLAIAIPYFIRWKSVFFRFMVSMTIVISSVLAMNSMNQKDIIQAEQRLKDDPIYRQRFQKWQNTEAQYAAAQENVNKYLDLQMTTGKDWSAGAKAARQERAELLNQKDRDWQAVEQRRQELESKGSRSYEAYVLFLHNFFPSLNKDSILNGSNLMMSLITDLQLTMFCLISTILFGKWVSIPVPRSLQTESKLFGKENLVRQLFAKCSAKVRQKFGLSSAGNRDPRCLSGTMLRGAVVMLRIYTEYRERGEPISQTKISRLAAQEMAKFRPKDADGNPLPYSPGFTSDVFRGRYDQLLQRKAMVSL